MPITGEIIDYFRLISLKSMVRLELAGIKIRRGPMVWPKVKREFKITGGKDAVYAWLTARVHELAKVQRHISED